MSGEIHPQVAAVLRQARQLQSVMDEQLHKMSSESFTASDDTNTVEVTVNGHQQLKSVFIQDGLLRLGAQAVTERLNEALHKATAAATVSVEADRERLDRMVAALTTEDRY